VIFTSITPNQKSVRFETKSGDLIVTREGELLSMDFPSRPPEPCDIHPDLIPALGQQPEVVLASRDYLAVYPSEEDVLALKPNFELLRQIDRFAVIVTAPGTNCDFISRFFAPAQGIPEDPVTGSAHCTLIPYWSQRLGKKKLHAFQVSHRGGELWCEDRGARVGIAGKAVRVIEGRLFL
jgi:PhzF family phenazine biosynthesis protein